jgi:Dolichyl-phosphate-mannose-protein mannosyltransferase
MHRAFRLLDHPAATLGLATVGLHLWANGSYGYFRDELYFIVCGRHPAWGYTDQPPLVPLIAAASDAAFHSLRGLRLVPALASAATVALAACAARVLGGRLYARWLAGLVVLASGTLPFWGVVLETDTLQPLAWLAIAMCVIMAEQHDEPRWLIAAGAIGGVAFLAKYTVALFLASVAVGLLVTPQRRLLAGWRAWAAVLIAVGIAAPNLLWQAANGWPFVAHTAVLAETKNIALSPLLFLAQQVLALGPASAPIWLAGLAAFAFFPRFIPYRWVAVSWVFMIAAAVVGHARPYYLAPAYPLLTAGGAVALEAWLPRLAKPAMVGFVLASWAVTAPFVIPVLPIKSFIAYQQWIGVMPSTGERLKLGVLPVYYADMFGWPELAEVVGKAYQALPSEDRKHAVFFGRNYGEAAAIDFFGAPWGLPPAISGHENYFLWGPRGHDGSVMLIYAESRDELLEQFRSVEPAGQLNNPLGLPEESGLTLWLCRDRLEPLPTAWPRLHHYA